MRRTKIIATVGPASSTADVLDELIAAGVDVFRLNFSHGTRESHGDVIARIRDIASRHTRHVALLQDLSGPKIRTGKLKGGTPLTLRNGDHLEIAVGGAAGKDGAAATGGPPDSSRVVTQPSPDASTRASTPVTAAVPRSVTRGRRRTSTAGERRGSSTNR